MREQTTWLLPVRTVLLCLALVEIAAGCKKVDDERNEPKKARVASETKRSGKDRMHDRHSEKIEKLQAEAKADNVDAQLKLGDSYAYGNNGLIQDYEKAIHWYRRAADTGDAAAQYRLGRCYQDGKLVKANRNDAAVWICRAAEQGHVAAMNELGELFKRGVGVKRDLLQAHKWFNLAAAGGDSTARNRRDRLARKMAQEKVIEAQRLAREFKPKPPQPVAERTVP
jgi:TPR repeat protein